MRHSCLSTIVVSMLGTHVFAQSNVSATVIDDVFANGNSQLQDQPNNSMWLFNGRNNVSIRTDQVGAVTFDVTPVNGSSEAFWAYFTNPGSPIVLGVGDKLSVSVTFSLTGFLANGQDVRWGVFDSLGTRNTTNLTGGENDSTFIGDTGYGLDWYPSGNGSPFVIGRRTVLSNANVFNNFGDFATITGMGATDRQTLVDRTPYTLTYTIERLSATATRISTAVTGGALQNLNYSADETSGSPNTSFDYFAFRISSSSFTSKITWYELLVQYTPAPPVITVQPQPSALTLQVGSDVSMTVGASGAGLTYQWRRNGQPVTGNPSATAATLVLTKVQHADAGTYTALILNAGGSITSSPVVLNISDNPVPPPPAITMQPAGAKVTLGNVATFSVAATGDNILYQWFRNGAAIPNANAAQLVIPNAQVTDSASYYVVISNSSGSVSSAPATLLVVSAMSPVSFAPAGGTVGNCSDSPLSIQFDQAPQLGKSGKITVYNSAGTIVDTLDMSANPQTRAINGTAFVYYPVIITDKIATLYLHQSLPYNDTYYITIDPAVLTDPSGAPFTGFADPSLWKFGTRTSGPAPGAASLTVAADNTGDYCSLQSALDYVPVNNTQPIVITVRKGTYTEINYVPSNKPFITVQGEDRDTTVVQYANNNALNGGSRAKFGVDANDFTLQNITIWNTTPHGGSQAEAVRGNGQRIVLNHVNLKSYQDTLWLQGLGFVTDSYIEGDVDFMWGYGAIYFQNSELKSLTSGGYYTQIRNGQGQNGNVYVNCRLTSADGVTGDYLGRIDPTQFPYSQTIYINCPMGPHIAPVGWLLNNSNSAPSVQWWEYGTTDLSGAPMDLSQRLNVSRQLSAAEAAQWSDPGYVLGGWVPFTLNTSNAIYTSPFPGNGSPIPVNWSAAVGHSADDWIGLYLMGSPDAYPIAKANVGSANTGRLTFYAPRAAGTYEFRYFSGDGTLHAISNHVEVSF
jgi:pectin methylesterase-like acyl-CoA thioesterase